MKKDNKALAIFKDDGYKLGDEPMFVAYAVRHPGLVGTFYLFGGFVTLALAPTMLPALALAMINDFKFAIKSDNDDKNTITVNAKTVVDPVTAPNTTIQENPWFATEAQVPSESPASHAEYHPQPVESPIEVEAHQPAYQQPEPVIPSSMPTVAAQTRIQTTTPMQTERKTALSVVLSNPYTSRAIFGSQRTGKSYWAAIASYELSKRGTKVFHINLASYGDEDSRYWIHADKSVCCDLTTLDPYSASAQINAAVDLVNEWWAHTDTLLIVDEWAYIGSTANTYKEQLSLLLKTIADKISAVASTGIKRKKALWTIAPEFVAGGLEADAKTIKKLQICLLAIPKGKAVDWQGSSITFNAELFDQLNYNYPLKPFVNRMDIASCDRVAYIDGDWIAVGLDSYSLPSAPTQAAPMVQPETDIPEPPDLDSLFMDDLDLDAMFDDVMVPTDYIDGLIKKAEQSENRRQQCFADFLNHLKKVGHRNQVKLSDLAGSGWAAKWNREGVLPDRKTESITAYAAVAVKASLLAEENGCYKVTLK